MSGGVKLNLIVFICLMLFNLQLKSSVFEEGIDYKYFLTVSAIFKDEGPWLKEWIEYNKLIGVDHFRLYNNESTDNYLEVLDPYIKKGEVTLIDWPGGHGDWCYRVQGPALLDAIDHLNGVSKWVALIDTDEFFVPTEKNDMVSFLKDYESFAAVVINWQNFGTSFVNDIPINGLLIESLVLKAPEQSWWNQQVKSIVRPECVDTSRLYLTPHQWFYFSDYFSVHPSKEIFEYGTIDVDKIKINHYVHRTEKYFWEDKLKKKAIMERYPPEAFIKNWHQSCNIEEDKTIHRFVAALKEKVFHENFINK